MSSRSSAGAAASASPAQRPPGASSRRARRCADERRHHPAAAARSRSHRAARAAHPAQVQQRVPVPFLLENNVYYSTFRRARWTSRPSSTRSAGKAAAASCSTCTTLHTNARNHGFDASRDARRARARARRRDPRRRRHGARRLLSRRPPDTIPEPVWSLLRVDARRAARTSAASPSSCSAPGSTASATRASPPTCVACERCGRAAHSRAPAVARTVAGAGMTALAFQTAMARLIVEPDFRDAVRARGRGRAARAADWPRGVAAGDDRISDRGPRHEPHPLHKGFRLGKLRALLPLTCSPADAGAPGARGRRLLAGEPAGELLRSRPRRSSSAPSSSGARLRSVYLGRGARLRARHPRARARPRRPGAAAERRASATDPVRLLGTLAAGRRPRSVPPRPCLLLGSKDGDAPRALDPRRCSASRRLATIVRMPRTRDSGMKGITT